MTQVQLDFPQATMADLAAMRNFLTTTATAVIPDTVIVEELVLAVNEALTNILVHGYESEPGDVSIIISQQNNSLVVKLRDYARPFDPTTVPAPDITVPLEQRSYGGMGVHMMREFTDGLVYTYSSSGENQLTLVKHFPEQGVGQKE